MLYYTIITNEKPRRAYMIPAKMDLATRTVIELDKFPRSDIKFVLFKFGDKNTVENIAFMDYSESR
jgi:hypothetical protein